MEVSELVILLFLDINLDINENWTIIDPLLSVLELYQGFGLRYISFIMSTSVY